MTGTYMAKLLLILMLTTQLLAGSGSAVYLCISGDGSYCCLDFGPDSCHCVPEEAAEPGGCGHHHGGESHHAGNSEHGKLVADVEHDPQLAGDSCGCTHVLIFLSANQPTAVSRVSASIVEVQRLSTVSHWSPGLVVDNSIVASGTEYLRSGGAPARADFSLTVVSTVVLRC